MNHDLHYLFQNKLKSFNKRKGGKGGVWGGWLEFQNKFRDLIQIHIAVFLPSIQQYDYNPEHSETSLSEDTKITLNTYMMQLQTAIYKSN